jgi:hypothetical protein
MQIEPENSAQEMITSHKIIRESDFHSQLQSATVQGDKANFNLILSMVTNDASELDAFHVPKSPASKDISELQQKFFVRPKPIYGKVPSNRSVNQNVWVHDGHLSNVQLDLALEPEPLATEQYDLAADVFNNLDFNSRNRLLNEASKIESSGEEAISDDIKALAKYKEVDVESWFNVLTDARAYSKLNQSLVA